MESEKHDFVVRRKGGGSVIDRRPIFSLDSRTLFLVWGETVRSYNAHSGEFIRHYEGLKNTAVGVQLNPNNPDHLIACSDVGELMEWNWKNGLEVRKSNLHFDNGMCRLVSFHLIGSPDRSKNKGWIYGVLSVNVKRTLIIDLFCLSSGKQKSKDVFGIELMRQYHSCAFGGGLEQPFVAGITEKLLQVAMLDDESAGHKQRVKLVYKPTCVACHPSSYCVLVGDITGRILLWQGFFSNTRPVYAEYHWHTLPVEDVVFSSMGSHFYSGGGECVLVKWTVDAPNQKKFLPRLAASLVHLTMSPENMLLALSTLDNAIQLVDTSPRLVSVIQHFSWSAENVRQGLPGFPAGIVVDPRSEALVLNGGTGRIQFFSLLQNSLLYQMNVTGQNILTQERGKVITNTDITRLALNSDGLWMATVEQRDDRDSHPELRLKFWQFNEEKQTYSLNTSIENPHKSVVYAVEFQPSSNSKQLIAVTTGDDFKFRVWSLGDSLSIYREGLVWRNESVGFFRNLAVCDVSFSSDGSLLAATFGPTLTLWISDTNEMKCSLTRSAAVQLDLTHVKFGRKECVHLVVTGCKTLIAVWNVLSLSLMWTVELAVSLLVADPTSCKMAAITRSNDLVIFSPQQSEPLYKQSSLISDVPIVGAVFAPPKQQLFFANSKWELFTLESTRDEFEERKKEEITVDQLGLTSHQPLTPFMALVARQVTSDVKGVDSGKHHQLGIPGAASIKQLLAAPSHTTAPMSLLCGPVLLALVSDVNRTSSSGRKKDISGDDDSGIVSSEEEEEEKHPKNSKFEIRKELALAKQDQQHHRLTDNRLGDLENKLNSLLEDHFEWTKVLAE